MREDYHDDSQNSRLQLGQPRADRRNRCPINPVVPLTHTFDQMRNFDPKRFPGNPALVEQMHQQLVAGVDALELQLRRQLDENRDGAIRDTDPAKVPAGYRDSVAEYYRKLSGAGR